MIIVSQDKNSIINFNNVIDIELDVETDSQNIFAYVGQENLHTYIHLGGYATKERAKEVLQDITQNHVLDCKRYIMPED